MRIGRLLPVFLFVFVCASCGLPRPPAPPPEISEKFEQVHKAVISRDGEALGTLIPGLAAHEDFEKIVAGLWSQLPEGKYRERVLGGWNWKKTYIRGGGVFTRYTRQYQYRFDGGYAFVSVVVAEDKNGIYVRTLRIAPLKGDLVKLHAWKFEGKPLSSYVFLGLMAFTLLLSLGAAVSIIGKWKTLRRPILWLIFVSVGFYTFTLNWTTGEIAPQILYSVTEHGSTRSVPYPGLLSIGILKMGPLSPWTFNLHIPLGALLYWLQTLRGRLARKPVPAEAGNIGEAGEPEEAGETGETADSTHVPRPPLSFLIAVVIFLVAKFYDYWISVETTQGAALVGECRFGQLDNLIGGALMLLIVAVYAFGRPTVVRKGLLHWIIYGLVMVGGLYLFYETWQAWPSGCGSQFPLVIESLNPFG